MDRATMNTHEPMTAMEVTEQRFVLWAVDALGLHVEGDDDSGYLLRLPPNARPQFDDAEVLRLGFDDELGFDEDTSPGAEPPLVSTVAGSKLFGWLVDQLRTIETPHGVPATQPVSVHEISPRLFAAYRVDGGTVRLGGCTFEDRPVLRLTRLESADAGPSCLTHRFFEPGGKRLDEALEKSLGLDEIVGLRTPPRKMSEPQVQHWIAVSGGDFHGHHAEGEPEPPPIAACVVWVKFAVGKLEFTIGSATGEVAFAEWARRFVTEEVLPPPYRCPHTGLESYHVAATDDGRISVAEAIQACEATGRRMLRDELATCEATNRKVLAELLETCPVQGKRVLGSLLQECPVCGQRVGPDALRAGRCQACGELAPVRKSDPRMARILDEYPKLDRWHRWQIAETSRVYILCAAAFFNRLLVVLDKESLAPLRLARRGRFAKRWIEAPAAERAEYLG